MEITRRKLLQAAVLGGARIAMDAAFPPPANADKSPEIDDRIKNFIAEKTAPKEPPRRPKRLIKEGEPDPSVIYSAAVDPEKTNDLAPYGLCPINQDTLEGNMLACVQVQEPYGSPEEHREFAAFQFNPDSQEGNPAFVALKSPLKNSATLNCFPFTGPNGRTFAVANFVNKDFNGLLQTQVMVYEVNFDQGTSEIIIPLNPPQFIDPGSFAVLSCNGAFVDNSSPDPAILIATTLALRKPDKKLDCRNAITAYLYGKKTKELLVSTDLVSFLTIVPGGENDPLGIYTQQTEDYRIKKAHLFFFKKDLSKKTDGVGLDIKYKGEPVTVNDVVSVFNPKTQTYDIVMQGFIPSLSSSVIIYKEVNASGNIGEIDNSCEILTTCPEKEVYWAPELCIDPDSGERRIMAGRWREETGSFDTVIINPKTREISSVPSPWLFFRTGHMAPHKKTDGTTEFVAASNGLKPETGLLEIKGYNLTF